MKRRAAARVRRLYDCNRALQQAGLCRKGGPGSGRHLPEDDGIQGDSAQAAQNPGRGAHDGAPRVCADKYPEAIQQIGSDGAHEHSDGQALQGQARRP